MIQPHGGGLVNKVLTGQQLQQRWEQTKSLRRLPVSSTVISEVRNIARGVFSPLTGFVGADDFASIIEHNQLASGVPWTIPIFFDVSDKGMVSEAEELALVADSHNKPFATLKVEQVYRWDKEKTVEAVFGTTDINHPGVRGFYDRGDYLVGGPVQLLDNDRGPYGEVNLFPAETRQIFQQRGWRTVCAFQTRNVPHRGHEELQKTVLGLVDGLFIQPVIGKKKPGDFRDDVIIESYRALIANYYPQDRVLLNILPFEMRYAGPKEAIMHAIMRKNYGCTHIIIGRDHAGVGDYYGEEEAIEIFDDPSFGDLEIQPITIRGDFWYCKRCARVASDRTCPHSGESLISFSGTEIRQLITDSQAPPPEVMRPEIFEVIRQHQNPLVT